jgi:secondary thiamine-phosphate synthase enzyme
MYHELSFRTRGNCELVNLTDEIQDWLEKEKIQEGLLTVFVPGSTGALTTIEYEPGLTRDFPDLMENLVPSRRSYYHDQTWHDGNGHSHLRASLIGPSLTVPIHQGKPTLGTWQQIIFIDFDNRPRQRRIVLHVLVA